ncbi:MAG: pyruvoyl-dependent arginine decarboxylase [Thermoplasmata archaeon]
MHMLPEKFFVTSGRASSKVTDLNAFDRALLNAGIGEQNLVPVSSVLPAGIEQVEPQDLPVGAITHCVLAQMRGGEGEMISAGISYAFRKDGEGGYVSEGHIHGTKKALREILEWKMEEMARLRNLELEAIRFRIEELSIPMDHYGACVAALIYLG